MEPTNEQLLLSIRKTLNASPAGDGDTRATRLVLMTVEELIRRERQKGAAMERVRTELAVLVQRGETLLPGGAAEEGNSWPSRASGFRPKDALDTEIEALWDRLVTLTSAMIKMRDRGERWKETHTEFLAEVARIEVAHKGSWQASDATLESVKTGAEDRLHGMSGYFSGRMGGGPETVIREVSRLSGGFSNETFRVTLAGANGTSLVVRLAKADAIMAPNAATLEEEQGFIELAREEGIPVPRTLWLESDRSILGDIFSVSEFVPGEAIGNSLGSNRPVSDALLRSYAAILAKLHRIDWQSRADRLPPRFVPNAKITLRESIDLMLGRIYDNMERSWLSPSPAAVMLFSWLRRNQPGNDSAPVLTHGDLGFHNWLFRGDEPAALLDWETVMLCSPAKDLANVRDVVVAPSRWAAFLDAYIAAGGTRPAEIDMQYFKMLRQLQALVCNSAALEKMFTVNDFSIDYLELGLQGRSFFYRQLQSLIPLLAA